MMTQVTGVDDIEDRLDPNETLESKLANADEITLDLAQLSAADNLLEPIAASTLRKPIVFAKLAGQAVFGTVFAASSTVLFIKPSQAYAASSEIGKWLSNKLGTSSWPLFYASSALDFGGTNLYLAAVSIPAFINYIQKQPTAWKKIYKGGGILLLAVTQNIQPVVITYATNAGTLFMIAATVGEFPKSTYVTMNLIEHDLPAFNKHIKKIFSQLKATTLDRCLLPPEDQLARAWQRAMHAIQQQFTRRIDAGWLLVLKRKDFIRLKEADALELKWLCLVEGLTQKEIHAESYFISILRGLVTAVGLGTAVNLLLAIWLNGQNVFMNNVPGVVADYLSIASDNMVLEVLTRSLAAFTCLSATYFFSKFMGATFGNTFDGIKNVLQGKPIDWLAFQLRPITMVNTFILGSIASLISYTTLLALFRANYNGPAKEELEDGLIVNIDLNHIIGLMKLMNLAVLAYASSSLASVKEKSLISLSHAKTAAYDLADESALSSFIEKMAILAPEARKELLGSKHELFSTIHNEKFSTQTIHHFWSRKKAIAEVTRDAEKEEKTSSRFAFKWCTVL